MKGTIAMSNKKHPTPPPPPPQHKEKPPKKRGGGCLLLLIFLLLLIILLLLLLNYLGLFGGGLGKEKGDGSGSGGSVVSSSVVDKEVEETSSDQKVYADITVSGDSYIFENNSSEINDIIKSINGLDGDVVVRINDQNASYNAMDQLKKALDEGKISYSETN